MDKISVIVPAYNIEKYLERCVESICAQTYRNIEIIIVDDGSTDNTAEIIDRLAENDARIVPIHKKNGGVTSARMAGVEKACGEWIGFVDGDDQIETEMFEHLMNNALTYDADISHCGYQMVFPDGRIEYFYKTGFLAKQDKITALKELLSGSRIEPGLWNKLFRKTLFHSLLHENIMPCDIKINEDLLMNYYLFKEAQETVYEDFCPYRYMLRKGSAATKKSMNHIIDPLRVIEIIKDDVREYSELYNVAYSRYIRILIGVATQQDFKEAEISAKSKLVGEVRAGRIALCDSKKLQLMAFGAAYMMPIYRIVRKKYDSLSGNDRKYEL